MRRLLTTTALALCLGATAAHAATVQPYSRTGFWTSWAGTNDEGHPQCTTSVENSYSTLILKYDGGHPTNLLVDFAKSGWQIPSGTRLTVQLQVDNAPARRYYAQGAGTLVEMVLTANDTDPVTGEPAITFLTDLIRNGLNLHVWFPDGSEGPWTARLNGAAAEIANLKGCMHRVMRMVYGGGGQPYAGGQSGQPYGRQQLPPTQRATQPYTPL